MINSKTLKNLEYDKLLVCLTEYLSSDIAKQKALNMQPYCDFEDAELSLKKTAEADRISYEFTSRPYFSFDDVYDALESSKNIQF